MSLSLDFSRARRAARFFRDHRRAAAIIVALALAIAAANALEPLVFKLVFDGLTRKNAGGILAKGIALFAAIAIAREALGALSNGLTWRTRLAVHHQLLDETVGRLHRLPISFYRSEGVGAIMTRLDRGISGVVEAA